MQFIDENVEEFFATARERYAILRRRRGKKQTPLWSKDPVFQTCRFSNVHREDDTTTRWIKKHVRQPMRNDPRVLTTLTACRFFNKISTLAILHRAGVLKKWNGRAARELLQGVTPVTGAAYTIKTPDGLNKADGVCWVVDNMDNHAHYIISNIHRGHTRLEDLWDSLRRFPFFESFMAYEIVTDLRYTNYLCKAPDIETWACTGTGACRGLSWIMAHNFSHLGYHSAKARKVAVKHMLVLQNIAQTIPAAWPTRWPRWEMQTVAHWLGQYARYVDVKYRKRRIQRKFP